MDYVETPVGKKAAYSARALEKDLTRRMGLAQAVLVHGWTTNGEFMVKSSPDDVAIVRRIAPSPETPAVWVTAVIPSAWTAKLVKSIGYSKDGVYQHMEAADGTRITFDVRYDKLVRRRFPKAEAFTTTGPLGPIVYVVAGEVVGLVMPVKDR